MRRTLLPILLFLSFDLFNSESVSATAIAIIRTGDEIIAAADSKSGYYDYLARKPVATEICKIQKLEGNVYFATAGLQRDITGKFDMVTTIRDSYKKSASVSQNVEASEALIKSSFLEALNTQKREHPEIFKKEFARISIVDFAFFGIERGSTFVYTRRLRAQDNEGGVSVTVHSENCPPKCKSPRETTVREITLLGQSLAMKKYIEQLRSGTNLTSRQIAENAVAAEIAHTSETVGPPIDILRIDRRGSSWVEVKNECR